MAERKAEIVAQMNRGERYTKPLKNRVFFYVEFNITDIIGRCGVELNGGICRVASRYARTPRMIARRRFH